ncbi:GntR family transcriptional regulator [Pedobacter glucosidilyticus]|uniref:GntR family transcriptional regulator n=1 Tax=Pedobacter glucosidilyticus TaxID=1122941 RepID=UPI0026EC487C|nr:GntR family transcriptional regulator [Pedobacter glucosidilyticus]
MKTTNNNISTGSGRNYRTKYMQLVEFITNQIETDDLQINDRLPSLNKLTEHLGMSKETVLKGLNYLSEKGIIESEYRKGYYVKKKSQHMQYRICLILDKMNILRDRIYQSFVENISDFAEVDVYFHHHNFKVFEKLIDENLNNYTHFVITTFFKESVKEVLNRIPANKRIILDYNESELEGDYTCIFQDYQSDIQECLTELLPQLEKYSRLVLVAPREAYHGDAIIKGFKKFTKQFNKNNVILNSVDESNMRIGDAFITFSRYDQDDVSIIKIAHKNNWKLGRDIGLLSYNDTSVKEVLEKGITVISTDFNMMGKEAALAILNKETAKIRDKAKIILRKSL